MEINNMLNKNSNHASLVLIASLLLISISSTKMIDIEVNRVEKNSLFTKDHIEKD